MKKPSLEVEVKFLLSDFRSYENKVRSIGAVLVQPRTHELNYRFDTADLRLTHNHQVLRLRQDNATILTYKGPAQSDRIVSIRPEIEIEVNDFQSAKELLEALGYDLQVKYEKWRTVYRIEDLELTIDEMPFGNFTEIEGGDPAALHRMASILALNWSARIMDSYLLLFDRLKTNKKLTLVDLTFENLRSVSVAPEDLGVKAADTPLFI
ncbi:MAG: class IV adenylate cyclase [Chloroflexi bacterium]|nr:class IV adenylate cyclase [Chloroflexota bacterium]